MCFSISLLGGITAPQIDTAYINEVVVTLEENGQPTAPFLRNYSVIMAGDVAFAEVLGQAIKTTKPVDVTIGGKPGKASFIQTFSRSKRDSATRSFLSSL